MKINSRSYQLLIFVTVLAMAFAQENIECLTDSDCPKLNSCELQKDLNLNATMICVHKKLLRPYTIYETGMMFVVFILSGLFNATGIGGGSLFVAFNLSALFYSTRQSVSIAYAILFGGSLAKTMFSLNLVNESSGKPLINYDVTMVLIPAMLVGSIVGVYLNSIFPSLVVLLCMTLLLILSLFKIYNKAVQKRNEEQEAEKLTAFLNDKTQLTHQLTNLSDNGYQNSQELSVLDINDITTSKDKPKTGGSRQESSEMIISQFQKQRQQWGTTINAQIEDIKAYDRRTYPWDKYIILLFILIVLMVFNVVKGTKTQQSTIVAFCSRYYWATTASQFVFAIIMVVFLSMRVRKENAKRNALDFTAHPDDFAMTNSQNVQLCIYSTITGLLAGLLGIGGGLVIVPLLLEIGLQPLNVSTTSSFCVLFTSTLNLVSAILAQTIDYTTLSINGGCSFLGSFIIAQIITNYVQKRNRTSLLLYLLVFLLIAAIIVIVGKGTMNVIDLGIADSFTFNWICHGFAF